MNNKVQLVVVGDQVYEAILEETRQSTYEWCKNNLLKSQDSWLTQSEAMVKLKIKSKAKMKAIRESGKVKFKKLGSKILYSEKSIQNL